MAERQSEHVREDYLTQGKIRSLAIKQQLFDLYSQLGAQHGLRADIVSGGQHSTGSKRTGSHRHDIDSSDPFGAADLKLFDPGQKRYLSLSNEADRPRIAGYMRDAAAAGATGIGAGKGYMGNETFHIGGGGKGAWGGEQDWIRREALRGNTAAPALATAAATATSDPRAASILRVAKQIGADPVDLATVISFETAGKFSPSIMGGKGGKYLGLIQFGPAEQQKYGVHAKQTFDEQLDAAGRFLVDRGYKPGMDRTHLYSTILAGNPYKQNISDTAAGGTPGGAAEKVRSQMAQHEAKARKLLGGSLPAPTGGETAVAGGAVPAAPAAGPTSPLPNVAAPAGGMLADTPDPFKAIADATAAKQAEQQAQQAAALAASQAAAQPPQIQQAAPAPDPMPAQQAQIDYAGLLMPRIKRGLLADDYSSGLLGAA